MHLILLQITDSANQAMQAVTNSAPTMSIWSLLTQGGVLMIPLFLLFALAVFFFFERYIAISKASKLDENFMRIIRDNILTGNVNAARSLSRNTASPVARMIDKGLQRIGKPIDAIEKSMENVGRLETYKLEKNLSVLSLVAGIAPMFGFLLPANTR
jgi:biopolymer transport protein ExbB